MIEDLQKTAMTQAPVQELPVLDFADMTFYVGNAKQAAHYYRQLFGFDIVAYRGPETGHRDTCAYVLQQNQITFVFTAALSADHAVAQHVYHHGDGVKDIGFKVSDVQQAYETAIARGARPVQAPYTLQDESGTVHKAIVATYGDTTHTFIDRSGYQGIFEPEFQPYHLPGQSTGLQRVDHIVGNVEEGLMDQWAEFYQKIFGFYVFRYYSDKDISTQYSALVSKVMANQSGTVKMPINAPASGLKKSQIQEYIDYYKSAGVQHLAISTPDIIQTVRCLRANGVELMRVPQTYYDEIAQRVGHIDESLKDLAELGILIDRDEEGYLLQIFTMPVQDRPTFFFEIIQRQGSEGFGKGNFKALFEAIERDQDRRGNL